MNFKNNNYNIIFQTNKQTKNPVSSDHVSMKKKTTY